MKNYGGSGYVIALSSLFSVMAPEKVPAIELAMEDCDLEKIEKLLNESLPSNYPSLESVLILGDDDESDELERGVWYAVFSEDDLFIREKSPAMKAMNKDKLSPKHRNWVIFG